MSKDVRETLKRLAAAEAAFPGSEFLAPVVRGHGVVVSIAGARCRLSVAPEHFEGWGIFLAMSHTHAELLREASALERQKYLRLFAPVMMIAGTADHRTVCATPANRSDTRFEFDGPVPVHLADRVELFDSLIARFDGSQFWFDQLDRRADPAGASYLRQEIAQMTDLERIDRPGLGLGQRIAYALEYTRRASAILAEQKNRADVRLTAALAHAGAVLRDFIEQADAYRVTYTIGQRRHTAIVRKGDLTVESAGICLAGRDRDFDLNSLVGVLRESADTFGEY